jgi:hypothetical protein
MGIENKYGKEEFDKSSLYACIEISQLIFADKYIFIGQKKELLADVL